MPEPVLETKSTEGLQGKKKASLLESIRKASAYDTEVLSSPDLQKRQEQILQTLPSRDELVNALTKHVAEAKRRDEYFAAKRREAPRNFNPRRVVRGELFERIVSAENTAFNFRAEDTHQEAPKKTEEHIYLENKFTHFLRYPDKYGFGELTPFRVPDISFSEMRDGQLMVLTATGEAKAASHLDYRAYRQLHPTGQRRLLERSVTGLNSLPEADAKRFHLEGFGKSGRRLAMIKNFTEYVIMCRDIDFSNLDTLIDRQDFDSEEYAEFKQMLSGQHPESKVKLTHSAFSEAELESILNNLWPDIEAKLAQQTH